MSMLLCNWLLEVKVTPQKVECEMMKFILDRQVHIFIFIYFLLCYLAWEKIVWTTYIKNAVKENVKIGYSPCLLLTVIWEKEWVSVELISSGTFDVLHKQQELSSCCHKALC